jgi:hypothetical protein
MKRPTTLLKELHLIEAMLDNQHPTVHFSPTDNVMLVGAAYALRWVLGAKKARRVTRLVRPKRRRFKREPH